MMHPSNTDTVRSSQSAERGATGDAPAVADDAIEIRALSARDDLDACVEIQRQIWGRTFSDLVPAAILKIAQRVGGITAGAFGRDGALLGFVFGLTGIDDGALVHWSHMLAVQPGARGGGVGRRLKAFQRDMLRRDGVVRIQWTCDPLVARNAHLNINVLGADVAEYVPNMYGPADSTLFNGLGATDRLVMTWHIGRDSERAAIRPDEMIAAPVLSPASRPADARVVRIEVPVDIERLQAATDGSALQWRTRVRDDFAWAFAHSFGVVGFQRDRDAAKSYYVLSSAAGAPRGKYDPQYLTA